MTRDEKVEAAARAMCVAAGIDPDLFTGVGKPENWEAWIDDAKTAIEEYEKGLPSVDEIFIAVASSFSGKGIELSEVVSESIVEAAEATHKLIRGTE